MPPEVKKLDHLEGSKAQENSDSKSPDINANQETVKVGESMLDQMIRISTPSEDSQRESMNEQLKLLSEEELQRIVDNKVSGRDVRVSAQEILNAKKYETAKLESEVNELVNSFTPSEEAMHQRMVEAVSGLNLKQLEAIMSNINGNPTLRQLAETRFVEILEQQQKKPSNAKKRKAKNDQPRQDLS